MDGKIEAWDSRSRDRVGILDCAMDAMPDEGGQVIFTLHPNYNIDFILKETFYFISQILFPKSLHSSFGII